MPALRYSITSSSSLLLTTTTDVVVTDQVTDIGIAALASKSPDLVSFSSKWCAQLGDESVVALSQYCPNLKRLDLGNSKVTEKGLLRLPAGLEALSLEWCLHIDKDCILKLHYLNNLKELNISNCLCFGKPQNVVTSKEVCQVLIANPGIEKLQLAGLEACGTQETLEVIRDHLPMLKVLDILLTSKEEEDAAAGLVEGMQTLTSESCSLLTSLTLDLSKLSEKAATDIILASLGLPNLPLLRNISITVPSLSQIAFETILADRCTLDSIEIRGPCPGLNDCALQKWLCGYMPSDGRLPLLDQVLRSGISIHDDRHHHDQQQRQQQRFSGGGLPGYYYNSIRTPTSAHGTVRSESNCVGLSDSDATVVRFSGQRLLPKKVYFVSSSSSEAETAAAAVAPSSRCYHQRNNANTYKKPAFPLLFDEHAQALQRVRRLIITDGLSGLTDEGVYMLSRILTYVQQLELLGCCDGVSEESAEVLKRRCRALKTLHITDANQQLIVKVDNSKSSSFHSSHTTTTGPPPTSLSSSSSRGSAAAAAGGGGGGSNRSRRVHFGTAAVAPTLL